jgi:hypothetical protein
MPLVPHVPAAEAEEHAALVVALDAGDLAGADLDRARHLAGSCAGCAALVTDLAVIRDAMTALPVPLRRRDYRLTEEDTARLRPSAWRRMRDWLAAPGSSVRPLATGLATLGVVGLLLTAGIPSLGSSAAAPEVSSGAVPANSSGASPQENYGPAAVSPTEAGRPADAGSSFVPSAAQTPAPEPLPSGAPGAVSNAAPSEAPGAIAGADASPTPPGERNSAAGAPQGSAGEKSAPIGVAADTSAPAGVPVALVASAALLILGLGLFLARALARRRPA